MMSLINRESRVSDLVKLLHQKQSQSVPLDDQPVMDRQLHLELRFWGTRGSIPVSGPGYLRHGGNTSCVSLTSDAGHLYIFDCGSGARELGNFLIQNNKTNKPLHGHIFLSHTHWDHIQGFPFFGPVFQPGHSFQVIGWGEESSSESLRGILAGQMEEHYFPVRLSALPSRLDFHSLQTGGTLDLDGAKLTTHILKHPLPSVGYRLDLGGKALVYATDHEPGRLPTEADFADDRLLGDEIVDPGLVELARGADVLIQDAQYSLTELAQKVGWGHNSVEIGVDTAIKAGVKRLVLYHHDPSHDDDMIDQLVRAGQRRAQRLGHGELEVIAASDGLKLDLA